MTHDVTRVMLQSVWYHSNCDVTAAVTWSPENGSNGEQPSLLLNMNCPLYN